MSHRNAQRLQELSKLAVEKNGVDFNYDKAIEEVAELTVAIQHKRIGRVGIDAVIDEIADVTILLSVLLEVAALEHADPRQAFKEATRRKLDRMARRLGVEPEPLSLLCDNCGGAVEAWGVHRACGCGWHTEGTPKRCLSGNHEDYLRHTEKCEACEAAGFVDHKFCRACKGTGQKNVIQCRRCGRVEP